MKWFKFAIFFQQIGFALSTFVPIYWRDALGFSDAEIAWMYGSSTAVSILGCLVFGRIGSMLAPHVPTAASFLIFAFTGLTMLVHDGIYYQTLFHTLHRFSVWGYLTLVPIGVMHILTTSVGKEFGRYRSYGSVGYVLGMLAAGVVSDLFGSGSIFIVLWLSALLAAFPFIFKIRVPKVLEPEGSYLRVLENRELRAFFISCFLITTYFHFVFVFFPLRLREMEASKSVVSAFLAMNGITATVALVFFAHIVDKFKTVRLMYVIAVAASLRVGLSYFPQTSVLWFALIQLLHMPTWALNETVAIKFIKETATPARFPRAQGLYLMSMTLGMSFGSAVGGWAVERMPLRDTFLVGAIIPLLAIPFIYAIEKRKASK